MLSDMIKLWIDVAAAEGSARVCSIVVLVSLVGNPEISKWKNQSMNRVIGLASELVYRAFGVVLLAVFEDVDRAAVFAARGALSGRGMCSEMHLAQRYQGYNRRIEGYDDPF